MKAPQDLESLYLEDETAWLNMSAKLVEEGRIQELDFDHLREFLTDMAASQRHAVESRLLVLIVHLLKWVYQPKNRFRSWKATIVTQRFKLQRLFRSKTLRNHGEAVLAEIYPKALELAAIQTDLPEATFPAECPFHLDFLAGDEFPD